MFKPEKSKLLSDIEKLKSVSRTTLDPEKIIELTKKIHYLENLYNSIDSKKNKPEQ